MNKPGMTTKDNALDIIDNLKYNGYVNNRERGILRRALLEKRPHGEWRDDNSNVESKEDVKLIKHMDAIKAYCKQCPGCINCPMFDNCAADNIRRFPRYWYIPEV